MTSGMHVKGHDTCYKQMKGSREITAKTQQMNHQNLLQSMYSMWDAKIERRSSSNQNLLSEETHKYFISRKNINTVASLEVFKSMILMFWTLWSCWMKNHGRWLAWSIQTSQLVGWVGRNDGLVGPIEPYRLVNPAGWSTELVSPDWS